MIILNEALFVPVLDSHLDTRKCFLITSQLKVAQCKPILRVCVLRGNLEYMIKPSNSVFIPSNLFITASNVVEQLLALSIDSETLLIVVDSSFNGHNRSNFLFLYSFLKPEVRVIHVIDSFLELIEVHGDLNHIDTDIIMSWGCKLDLFNLIFQMYQYDIGNLLMITLTQHCLFFLSQLEVLIFKDFCNIRRLKGLQ